MGWFFRRANAGAPARARGSALGSGHGLPDGSGELMARVKKIQIRTHVLVDDALAGAYKSAFRGSGVEFEEVRPYQPGDDVRTIDWKRTAKQSEAYVKTYVEERELAILFLVDTSRSMDFGSLEVTKRERAAEFCALLAYVALRQQDLVGLCLFGAQTGLHLSPRKGGAAVARVVREVIAAPTTSGAAAFDEVLEHQQRTLRRRSLVFLISDFLGVDAANAPWSDALARLARRHDVIAVRVGDPFEERLPAVGWVELADLESGERGAIDARSAAVRAAWESRARERKAALDALLLRARVESIELSTAGSVSEPVVRFFQRRKPRRGRAS
jgi:uncharacterized protein (DUF58 family)